MTVKELKNALEEMPDDAYIMVVDPNFIGRTVLYVAKTVGVGGTTDLKDRAIVEIRIG